MPEASPGQGGGPLKVLEDLFWSRKRYNGVRLHTFSPETLREGRGWTYR
jgi:hypothetical protein